MTSLRMHLLALAVPAVLLAGCAGEASPDSSPKAANATSPGAASGSAGQAGTAGAESTTGAGSAGSTAGSPGTGAAGSDASPAGAGQPGSTPGAGIPPGSPGAPGAPGAGGGPASTAVKGAGVEVQRKTPGSSPTRLPGLTAKPQTQAPRSGATLDATAPLIALPLPSQGSSRAALVKGYPTAAVPPAPGSSVRVSSVSPSGRSLQVALDATSQGSGEEVLRFYRQHLGGLGFSERPVTAPSGSTAVAFQRGTSSVTLTTSSTTKAYSVYAVLSAD